MGSEVGGLVLVAAAQPVSEAPTSNPMLLLELGAVVIGLAVLARVADRIGVSPIPLYLLGGLAFGHGGLTPLELSEEFVEIGAELGVILLLLMLGLEFTAEELRSGLRSGLPAGLVDLALNFTPGLVAGLLLDRQITTGILLGGITYISSSGVVAKVLGDLEWLGNRETPSVLSLLVMEDLTMAVYLPLVIVLLAGGGLLGGLASLAAAVGLVAGILVLALRYSAGLSRLVLSRSDEVLLLTILGLTLLVAAVAQRLEVSNAIGAFLVGIAISGGVAHQARQLLQPLRDLFAAVFFLFFGLQTDPGQLPAVLPVAALLAVVTAATKVATGWWAAGRAGVALRGRLRAGLVLTPRGEFSIIIAGLGVAAGGAPELGALAAAYVLLLAVAGPLLARAAHPLATFLQAGQKP